jgi:single-strand DNA-binding protein
MKERIMRNISEFRIIGRVGRTEVLDKVAYINVAANYGRKVDGEWQDDTHWNRVTVFGKAIERVQKMNSGDLVHISGRVRQTKYDRQGETVYGVDLIADAFAILANNGKPADDDGDD